MTDGCSMLCIDANKGTRSKNLDTGGAQALQGPTRHWSQEKHDRGTGDLRTHGVRHDAAADLTGVLRVLRLFHSLQSAQHTDIDQAGSDWRRWEETVSLLNDAALEKLQMRRGKHGSRPRGGIDWLHY